MKQVRRNKFLILLMALALVVPATVFCQPPPDANDVDAPIDGGISLLVAAGAAIGAKKIRDSRKK